MCQACGPGALQQLKVVSQVGRKKAISFIRAAGAKAKGIFCGIGAKGDVVRLILDCEYFRNGIEGAKVTLKNLAKKLIKMILHSKLMPGSNVC